MPVVPATQEAEVGGLLEPRRSGCSESWSYYCTPAWVTEHYPVSGKKLSGMYVLLFLQISCVINEGIKVQRKQEICSIYTPHLRGTVSDPDYILRPCVVTTTEELLNKELLIMLFYHQ